MNGRWFFVLAAVLAAVDILIPFLVLRHIGSFLSSFLFWSALTAVIILFAGFATRPWRDR